MIITLLAGFCILGVVLFYDLDLRIRWAFFSRKNLERRTRFISREVPRLFFAIARTFLGFTIKFENKAGTLPKRFMIVSNHQSLMDIPILFFYFAPYNVRFVAKKELGHWVPLISQVLRIQKHCLVDRKANRIQSMKNIDTFSKEAFTELWSPAIFPEGTRSHDGAVHTFHTGGVRRMLELAPMPVVTVAMDGGWNIRGLKDLVENIKGGSYRVKVLSIYDTPTDRASASAILEKAHEEIKAQVYAWNGQGEAPTVK